MTSNARPPTALPLARIYTQPYKGYFRAVIHLQNPAEQHVVDAAALQIEGGVQPTGARRKLTLEFFGNGIIVLVGRHRKHTPSILLKKAKLLAEQLGHRTQVVAPPH